MLPQVAPGCDEATTETPWCTRDTLYCWQSCITRGRFCSESLCKAACNDGGSNTASSKAEGDPINLPTGFCIFYVFIPLATNP